MQGRFFVFGGRQDMRESGGVRGRIYGGGVHGRICGEAYVAVYAGMQNRRRRTLHNIT